MNRTTSTAIALLLTLQIGCGAIQRPSWNKPFSYGTWIPAAVCALAGGGAGVGIQEATRGCNRIPGTDFEDCDDVDYWKGALIGAAVGAVACGLAGHVFLDPTPTVALPPPDLTPLPTPTEVPPPPPPPAAEPDYVLPEIVTQRIVLRGINFAFNSSDIDAASRPVLDEAVGQLQSNPGVDVTVIGHTDSIGSDDYNRRLSISRAEAVYRYLVNRGIAPERLTTEGMGESSPVASNDTEDGRARNRRVELRVSSE